MRNKLQNVIIKKETSTPEETKQLAISIAKEAKAGDVILLHGDLGVGKTVFSQGFAKGLMIEEPIQSPTYTILQEYEEGTYPFYKVGDISRNVFTITSSLNLSFIIFSMVASAL